MSKFFNSNLAQLVPYTPGEQPRSLERLIKLNTNENPFPPAPSAQRVLNMSLGKELRLYNDPTAAELVQTLAETYGVSPQQVTVSNGSDEMLAFSFMAFGEQGVAFADITYGFYPVLTDLFRLPKTLVPLHEDFSLQVADYAGVKGTVVVANPNAPTGMALPRRDIETLLQQDANRLVIVDEAYGFFGAQSALPLLQKYDNLLIVCTFSKSRSMAGARLGFAIGREEVIADINRVRCSFHPYNVNTVTQKMAVESLREKMYFEACCTEIIALRTYLTKELEAQGCTVLPSLANFIFVKPNKVSAKEYFEALRQNNIIVRYFTAPRVCDYVRISVGNREDMETLIGVSKQILK